ncbi:MAG: glycosyltransferase family 4 protein [Bacteroidia bacterium]|nr:glycosyltransferase family 4 protein [Bacteroidia bacterium]
MSKILFVSGWYPTEDKPSFGIFVRRHAEAAALNNDVAVLYIRTTYSGDEKLFNVRSGIENKLFEVIITINKSKLPFAPLFFLFKYLFFLRALIKGYNIIVSHYGKPDLVHGNILFEGGMQALMLKSIYGIPYVCAEQWTGYMPEDGSYKGLMRKWCSKQIALKAKYILPISNHLKEAMTAQGLNARYVIIPNVVNTQIFHPSPTGKAKGKTKMLHVSSLDERQKNFSGILRAFKKISMQDKEAYLTVSGGKDNLVAAKKLVIETGIEDDKVIFMGHQNESELASTYSDASFLLMFSNYETLCCVALEAIACGIPVVATRSGGIEEVVNSSNGILVDTHNEEQLVSAIEAISVNLEQFSPLNLFHYVNDNYSYEKINHQLNEVYTQTLTK